MGAAAISRHSASTAAGRKSAAGRKARSAGSTSRRTRGIGLGLELDDEGVRQEAIVAGEALRAAATVWLNAMV